MLFKTLPGLYISARTVADALEAQRSSRLLRPTTRPFTCRRPPAAGSTAEGGGPPPEAQSRACTAQEARYEDRSEGCEGLRNAPTSTSRGPDGQKAAAR